MHEFNVAVRDLADFCHRSGDIDHRFGPSPTAEEGIAGHQRVYERRPESWHREHPVEYRHEGDSLALLLRRLQSAGDRLEEIARDAAGEIPTPGESVLKEDLQDVEYVFRASGP